LFDTPARELLGLLGKPTLIHLQGQQDPPIFFSTLLHGNETSGWEAMCEVFGEALRRQKPLPRNVLLFIGNVEAAAQGVRSLPGQMDFNRIWRGEHEHTRLVQEVLVNLQRQPLFAALDIHNNTGRNPHYSVVTEITPQTTGLAYLFSDKAVLVEEPDSVLTRAVQHLCPSTTVEVGPVNDVQSTIRTAELLRRYLQLPAVPDNGAENLTMHRALARVHVVDGVSFDFADEADAQHLSEDDLVLTAGMEAVNFHAVPAGTEFGFTRKPLHLSLQVLDPDHRDVTAQFLEEVHGDISLCRAVIPAMYTTDHDVIRQDCLCYFMEEI
jgi:succinylglutamate desuccinylase